MSSQLETLLSFYTQWSLAHATIVVATVFGLFSVLRMISSNRASSTSRKLLIVVYLLLLVFGTYETHRFIFYGQRAHDIARSEFGAELWYEPLIPIQPFVDLLFGFSPFLLFGFGLFTLYAGSAEVQDWTKKYFWVVLSLYYLTIAILIAFILLIR